MSETNFTVVDNSNVYYQGHYWNDYELVRAETNKRISGSEHINWYQHFINTHKGRTFKKALFINCGNGWVEREIYRTGLFEEAVGVDYLQSLVEQAQKEAAKENYPFWYYQLDINTGVFPESGFDLVVNHAGCHHIAYLDKVLRAINKVMSADGYFINYDYVGPHRNQYPYEQWNEIYLLNNSLPEDVRNVMAYPHLPTMLSTDPTEAIHSELILEYTYRYFNIEEHKRAGGALAYPILTFNKNMQHAASDKQNEWIRYVMDKDLSFTEKNPHMSMFDYFIGVPNKAILNDFALLQTFEEKEMARESNSVKNSGMYYPLSLLQNLYLEIEDLKFKNESMRIDLHKIYSNPLSLLTATHTKEKLAEVLKRLKTSLDLP
jgi:SAM-dependent methyltransferase